MKASPTVCSSASGGLPSGKALTTDDAAWRDAFEPAFLGAVRFLRDQAPAMADGGAIARILAIPAEEAFPVFPISTGLRPGLAMLVESFADELGLQSIRVDALLPNLFATDRVKTALGQEAAPVAGMSPDGSANQRSWGGGRPCFCHPSHPT